MDGGGSAIVDHNNVADFGGARNLVEGAIRNLGDINILVNNAGILRDRMIFNMDVVDWEEVVTVHGMGHFGPTHFACSHWRDKAKRSAAQVYGRLIHTTSRSGLFSAPGQSNYDFAKAGIASFSTAVAREMDRYRVTSNAIAPVARTRLTTGTFGFIPAVEGFDPWEAANVAPFVAYLASPLAAHISGQIFVAFGGRIELIDQPKPAAAIEKSGRWTMDELAESVGALFDGRSPQPPVRSAIL